jgi:isopenicillin N synthase-like dioxygenase
MEKFSFYSPRNLTSILFNFAFEKIMSNGIFKSPVHRVMTNARKGRTSMVMFSGPDLDKVIGPADQLIDDRRPARYKRVKAKDYFAGLFQRFSRGARVIDTVRI